MLDFRHRAQRHQLSIRPAHVNVFQLLRIQPLGPLDLGNDLVTPAGNVEAIDEVAADARRKIGAHQLHIETHRGHLVVVENNFGLRLIDLGVDQRWEIKHPALGRLLLNLLGELQNALRIGG